NIKNPVGLPSRKRDDNDLVFALRGIKIGDALAIGRYGGVLRVSGSQTHWFAPFDLHFPDSVEILIGSDRVIDYPLAIKWTVGEILARSSCQLHPIPAVDADAADVEHPRPVGSKHYVAAVWRYPLMEVDSGINCQLLLVATVGFHDP